MLKRNQDHFSLVIIWSNTTNTTIKTSLAKNAENETGCEERGGFMADFQHRFFLFYSYSLASGFAAEFQMCAQEDVTLAWKYGLKKRCWHCKQK